MTFQRQDLASFWARQLGTSNPEEAMTEPAAPQRVSYPGQSKAGATYCDDSELVDLDHQVTAIGDSSSISRTPPQVGRVSPPPPLSTLAGQHDAASLEPPSSAVRCAIPITLRTLTGNPRALVTLIDVDRIVIKIGQALDEQTAVWIRLPFATGAEVVRGRVIGSDRHTPSSPWEVQVKLEVAKPETRSSLVQLIYVLGRRSRR